MIRIFIAGLAILIWLAPFRSARADQFTIDLDVHGPKAARTVHAEKPIPPDLSALGSKPKPREVLEIQPGDKISIKWTLTSTAPKETIKDVLVHFYAVKINKAGDSPPPKLDKNVLLESALTMDFKPKDKNEGELSLHVEKPGVYLLRLETLKAKGAGVNADNHEYFASMDVIAK
jgi:hypothetical protein